MRGGVWSSDRSFTSAGSVFTVQGWVRATQDVNTRLSFRTEAWIGRDFTNESGIAGDLREGYLKLKSGALELKLGRQIVSWGRADKINPTDVFAARDYRLMVADDTDNHLGIAGAQAKYTIGQYDLSVVAVPEFRPTMLPNGESREPYAAARHVPDGAAQFGLKLNHSGQSIDWALYVAYFNDRVGYVAPLDPQHQKLGLLFPKVGMVGADLAAEFAGFGIRGEIAAFSAESATSAAFSNFSRRVSAVVGLDRTVVPGLNLNVQAIATLSAQTPCSTECARLGGVGLRTLNGIRQFSWRPTVIGLSLRSRYDFSADRGFTEATVVAYDGGGAAAQIRCGYKLSDDISVQAGVDSYAGRANTVFGALRKNDAVFLELRRGF